MATYGRSLDTTALAETVWRIWSDPSTWAEWNPDMESCSIDGPFQSGTPGKMRTRSGGAHDFTLADVRPGESFRLQTRAMPGTLFSFHCSVKPAGGGGSTISQELSMSGPLAPLFSRMAGPRIAESFPAILQALARRAEGDGSAG